MAKKKPVKRLSGKTSSAKRKTQTPPKPDSPGEVVHILHEGVAGYRCPACGEDVFFMEDVTPCDHLLGITLDLVGNPFFDRKRSPKGARPVTFAVADAPGPHGGTMTLVFDLQGAKGDPKELYWRANKDQKAFCEALARDEIKAKEEAKKSAERPEEIRRNKLVEKLWKAASEEGAFFYEGQLEFDRVAQDGRTAFLADLVELLTLTLETRAHAPSDYELSGAIERCIRDWQITPLPHPASFALAAAACSRNDIKEGTKLLEECRLDPAKPLATLDDVSLAALRRFYASVMGFRAVVNRLWGTVAETLDQKGA